jgi:hypothetical protein
MVRGRPPRDFEPRAGDPTPGLPLSCRALTIYRPLTVSLSYGIAQNTLYGNFGGLAAEGDGISTLDGSTNACAWWAIGTTGPYGSSQTPIDDVIPAYDTSDAGQLLATRTRLWVR